MNPNITKMAHTHPFIGQRVRVRDTTRFRNSCRGQTGTVRSFWSRQSVGVELDNLKNQTSKHGYFYFDYDELEIIDNENEKAETAKEEGDKNMSTKTETLTGYLNVVEVQFLNDTSFRTIECANYDFGLSENDICVVATKSHGFALAQVLCVKDHPDADLFREVVDKLDTYPYENRVEKRKAAAVLRAKMQARAQQLQDVVLYQTLAKEDPEMANLLQEFTALNK